MRSIRALLHVAYPGPRGTPDASPYGSAAPLPRTYYSTRLSGWRGRNSSVSRLHGVLIVNAGGKRLSCGGPKLHTFLVSVPASSLWLARQPCGLGGVFDV